MGKSPDLIDALRIDGMTMASNVLEAKLKFGLDFELELYKRHKSRPCNPRTFLATQTKSPLNLPLSIRPK
jgi:hypothetical protein